MQLIFRLLLVNSTSRSVTLDYLSKLLGYNRKRSQLHVCFLFFFYFYKKTLQATRSQLASNGVMLNLMYVMLDLSEKIMLNKIQDNYIFHPKNRIDLNNEARLSFTPDVVNEISAEVGKF